MRRRTKILSRHQEIRVMRYVGIYVAIFLAARLIWGWEASHRLAVARSELAATSVDVDAKPPVRTHSGRPNQLTALAEVAEKLALTGKERLLVGMDAEGYGNTPGVRHFITSKELPAAHLVLDRYQYLMDQVDAIRKLEPPDDGRLAGRSCYDLANLICADAWVAHLDGDEAKALRRVNEALYMSGMLVGYPGRIRSNIDGVIFPRIIETIERASLDLKLEASPESLSEAQAIIATLRTLTPTESQRASYAKELYDDEFDPYLRGWRADYDAWWIRPIVDDQLREECKTKAWFLGLAKFTDWQSVNTSVKPARLDPRASLVANAVDIGDPLAESSFLKPLFEGQVDASAVEILLATDVFRAKHGRFPASAGEMVPEVLPEIPVDPYTKDHSPLHYRLDAGGPTVWSVGENGIDDGAVLQRSGVGQRYERHAQLDIIYGAGWDPFDPLPPWPALVPGEGSG